MRHYYFLLSVLITLHMFYYALGQSAVENHVIFKLKNNIKNQKNRDKYNQKIHAATYELKQLCKQKHPVLKANQHYQHRNDSVFFIHIDHDALSWTLYKPSNVSYKNFVYYAQKIYGKYGLKITIHPEKLVTIAAQEKMLTDTYLTLEQLESYKKSNESNKVTEQADSKVMLDEFITKFLSWHLQIPTTGCMPAGIFDIPDQYKPLAWNFLLWDLAPKKGQGAQVALIDTGVSAFTLQDSSYRTMYKKNVNITVDDPLEKYGYNLVSQHGLDPIAQIAINFGHYCDHTLYNFNELMEQLPSWIIDFIKNKKNEQIRQYFVKNAEKKYLNEEKKNLNEKGEEALKDLLYGKYGIMQSENNSFFHVVKLENPYNQDVILETLPAPQIAADQSSSAAGHGTFTQGMIHGKLWNNQGITGIAPQAQVTMIKAFHDDGTTNKTTLQAALQRALALKKSIVSMSLKITDDIDPVQDAPLKDLIDSIDYVVAASGNDGHLKELANKQAYPAKFDSVAFDVGAFAYQQGSYEVCPFTQKELTIGPKFVAPGYNILSAGLSPHQKEDSMYMFMTGTSIAVPVISGFIALVLAEFQDIFTREQILKVMYKFSMKLRNDDTWQQYIKLGTPDMRSTLLCLHSLQALQITLKNRKDLNYSFDQYFEQLVQAIYTINYYVPTWYEKTLGYSFVQDFAHYAQAATSSGTSLLPCNTIPSCNSVKECVTFIENMVIQAIEEKKNKKKLSGTKQSVIQNLENQLHNILTQNNFSLFSNYSKTAQNRITKALVPRNACSFDKKIKALEADNTKLLL